MTRFDINLLTDLVKAAIEREGLRPLARKLGISIGVLRSAQEARELSASNLIVLCRAFGLEFYMGQPRNPTVDKVLRINLEGDDFAAIPRFDAQLAAGDGLLNEDQDPIDHLAFSRKWLDSMSIAPSKACLLTVKGNSMEPALRCGDLVMIDKRKRTIRPNRIYAFRDVDGGARIKRLEIVPDVGIVVRSDNPDHPTEYRMGEDMNRISEGIIGEVVWSGHSWK